MNNTYKISLFQKEITRPADTTAYTAGDIITNTAGEYAVIVLPIGGYLNRATISTSNAAHTASLRLNFLDTVPAPTLVDNAALALTNDNKSYLGAISYSSFFSPYANLAYSTATINDRPFSLKPRNGGSNVYCVLQAITGFTPLSGQKFVINLMTEETA